MKFNQIIAKRTRALMKERNWTQYKLSQQSGLPKSTLSHTLSGKGDNIEGNTILNICRGLDISIFEFFNDPSFLPENIADD
ncbi:MAG: helix-turn-helix transcriptional regulator [Clostridia bacterium]|nr:helix-turn-helix transcriptional regulator [Clostridia bacterium]